MSFYMYTWTNYGTEKVTLVGCNDSAMQNILVSKCHNFGQLYLYYDCTKSYETCEVESSVCVPDIKRK